MSESYECIESRNSYKLFRSQKCGNCSESYFLYNCSNCHHCFGCINLNNQSYCIENIQYSKEEYDAKLQAVNIQSRQWIEQYYLTFLQIQKSVIHKYADFVTCENVRGNSLEEASNCHHCFDLRDAKDNKYCIHGGFKMEDCYDGYGIGANASLMYEIVDT